MEAAVGGGAAAGGAPSVVSGNVSPVEHGGRGAALPTPSEQPQPPPKTGAEAAAGAETAAAAAAAAAGVSGVPSGYSRFYSPVKQCYFWKQAGSVDIVREGDRHGAWEEFFEASSGR